MYCTMYYCLPGPPEVDDVDLLLGLVQVPPDRIVAAGAGVPLVLRVDNAGAVVAAAVAAGDAAPAATVAEDALLGGLAVGLSVALAQ